MQQNQTKKWSHTQRAPGQIPGYRRPKPIRFTDWAAI